MNATELRLLNSQLLEGKISLEEFKSALQAEQAKSQKPNFGKAKKSVNDLFNQSFRSLDGIANFLIKNQTNEDVRLFLSLIPAFYDAKSNNEKRQILSKQYLTDCLISSDLYFKKSKSDSGEIYTTDQPKDYFTVGQVLTAIRKANI